MKFCMVHYLNELRIIEMFIKKDHLLIGFDFFFNFRRSKNIIYLVLCFFISYTVNTFTKKEPPLKRKKYEKLVV